MGRMGIAIKRIYESPEAPDGYRVLVDRLWPRGMTKERAALDLWMKDVAPSPQLRKWFGHDPARFAEFRAHTSRSSMPTLLPRNCCASARSIPT